MIESVSLKGPSATIKSHHNVGGLPERMKLKLVEPLRELFKDEVRALGAELGLPRHVLWRQPFPGPGLAVRVPRRGHRASAATCCAPPTRSSSEEIRAAGLYESIWQSFGVLLPVQTRRRDGRRAHLRRRAARCARCTRSDGMTADWVPLPYELLGTHLAAHHQRGARHQPRGLRHLVEAARRPSSGSSRAALARVRGGVARCRRAALRAPIAAAPPR